MEDSIQPAANGRIPNHYNILRVKLWIGIVSALNRFDIIKSNIALSLNSTQNDYIVSLGKFGKALCLIDYRKERGLANSRIEPRFFNLATNGN